MKDCPRVLGDRQAWAPTPLLRCTCYVTSDSDYTSLSLYFIIYKAGMVILTSQDYNVVGESEWVLQVVRLGSDSSSAIYELYDLEQEVFTSISLSFLI